MSKNIRMVVYVLRDKINNLVYVGQKTFSRQSVFDNYYGSGKILNTLKNKYGLDTIKERFTKTILEECYDNPSLCESEKKWIAFYKATDKNHGYNLTEGGEGWNLKGANHPRFGKHPKISHETKEKMRLARIGKVPANKGVPLSEERKKWLSDYRKGKKNSEQSKIKNRIASTGRRHSEEAKRKIGIAHKGKIIPDDIRRRLSEINLGKKHSIETRKKMSIAQIARNKKVRAKDADGVGCVS